MARYAPESEKLENEIPPASGLKTRSVGTENITCGLRPGFAPEPAREKISLVFNWRRPVSCILH